MDVYLLLLTIKYKCTIQTYLILLDLTFEFINRFIFNTNVKKGFDRANNKLRSPRPVLLRPNSHLHNVENSVVVNIYAEC